MEPPPSYNSKGFVGWAPATPSFGAYKSLVKLCAVAPFRFVFMQAPCGNLFVVLGHFLVSLIHNKKGQTLESWTVAGLLGVKGCSPWPPDEGVSILVFSLPPWVILILCLRIHCKGAFSHSAGTARAQRAHSANSYSDYPGTNPENHPPAESCTIHSNLKNSNI